MGVSLLAPVCIVVRYAGMHSDIYLFHIKSFKKCGISNAMDGTEDDAIFEQSDSSDDNDEELADKESDEEFNDFYD